MTAAGEREPLDWDGLMAMGLGLLRLSPAAFWAMTLKEMAAVLRGLVPRREAPLRRAAFAEMMRRFPDH